MNTRRRHAAKRRRAFPLTFVNAYAVDRCYGGAEEGGWWYDAGDPLVSVRVRTEEGIERTRARLRVELADAQYYPGRSSVIGGPDLEVYIEEHPARHYPEYRPHYE